MKTKPFDQWINENSEKQVLEFDDLTLVSSKDLDYSSEDDEEDLIENFSFKISNLSEPEFIMDILDTKPHTVVNFHNDYDGELVFMNIKTKNGPICEIFERGILRILKGHSETVKNEKYKDDKYILENIIRFIIVEYCFTSSKILEILKKRIEIESEFDEESRKKFNLISETEIGRSFINFMESDLPRNLLQHFLLQEINVEDYKNKYSLKITATRYGIQ